MKQVMASHNVSQLEYENDTDKKLPVAEARVTQIEVKYDSLSTFDYEKVFDSIEVVTEDYTFKMDGRQTYINSIIT
ncbi:MAG: hypothetical protein ACLTAI_01615 [Thomasclavelia sp.]